MKRILHILLVFSMAFLSSCAPQISTVFVKKNSSRAQVQRDFDACKIKSFREIPQNIVSTYHPGVNNPGTLSCNTIGSYTSCNRIGALYIPPSEDHEDVNAGLRDRYMINCMSKKGYDAVDVPVCSMGQQEHLPTRAKDLTGSDCIDPRAQSLE